MSTIRELRVARNMPQAELAARAGISYPVINRMENGKPVNRLSFELVCKVLGVNPADIEGVVLSRRVR